MKHNFRTVALFIGLSMLAIGCQKENIVEPGISIALNLSGIFNIGIHPFLFKCGDVPLFAHGHTRIF